MNRIVFYCYYIKCIIDFSNGLNNSNKTLNRLLEEKSNTDLN